MEGRAGILAFVSLFLFISSSDQLEAHGKKKGQSPTPPPPPPALTIQSICEEDADQFRWVIENNTNKKRNFILRATDNRGQVFRGEIGPHSSRMVITYRKLKYAKGADDWQLRSQDFSVVTRRNRNDCERLGDPQPEPTECPPVPEPVICPPVPEPVACPEIPPIPEPVICPEPVTCPPPEEPVVCPAPEEPTIDTPTHACIDQNSVYASMPALTVQVKVRSDLIDTLKSFNFFQDITFTLETCDTITLIGKLTTSSSRNQLSVDSKIYLSPEQLVGAQRISLIAEDGTVLFQNDCTDESCYLGSFLLSDLQGNFGLPSGNRYAIVVDYLENGVSTQKVAIFNTY